MRLLSICDPPPGRGYRSLSASSELMRRATALAVLIRRLSDNRSTPSASHCRDAHCLHGWGRLSRGRFCHTDYGDFVIRGSYVMGETL